VSVESTLGRGSTFTFFFLLEDNPVQLVENEPEAEGNSSFSGTIQQSPSYFNLDLMNPMDIQEI
jgi:hypothetical protein